MHVFKQGREIGKNIYELDLSNSMNLIKDFIHNENTSIQLRSNIENLVLYTVKNIKVKITVCFIINDFFKTVTIKEFDDDSEYKEETLKTTNKNDYSTIKTILENKYRCCSYSEYELEKINKYLESTYDDLFSKYNNSHWEENEKYKEKIIELLDINNFDILDKKFYNPSGTYISLHSGVNIKFTIREKFSSFMYQILFNIDEYNNCQYISITTCENYLSHSIHDTDVCTTILHNFTKDINFNEQDIKLRHVLDENKTKTDIQKLLNKMITSKNKDISYNLETIDDNTYTFKCEDTTTKDMFKVKMDIKNISIEKEGSKTVVDISNISKQLISLINFSK